MEAFISTKDYLIISKNYRIDYNFSIFGVIVNGLIDEEFEKLGIVTKLDLPIDQNQFIITQKPIESLVKKGSYESYIKRFTFFSALQLLRKFQMNLLCISFNKRYYVKWFPPSLYTNSIIFIHSPNTLPTFDARNRENIIPNKFNPTITNTNSCYLSEIS